MSINYGVVVLQVIFLIIYWIAERLLLKIFRPAKFRAHKHIWWAWAIILWIMTFMNLGYYWPAYPIAIWMVLALLLICIQVAHNHEFIYRRYWPVFWRFSAYYALIMYVAGIIIANWLPLI